MQYDEVKNLRNTNKCFIYNLWTLNFTQFLRVFTFLSHLLQVENIKKILITFQNEVGNLLLSVLNKFWCQLSKDGDSRRSYENDSTYKM